MGSTVLIRPTGGHVERPSSRSSLPLWPSYPLTTDIAKLAGKLDAEQQKRGVVIPFVDLLIGATAVSLGYSVLTVNPRHFGGTREIFGFWPQFKGQLSPHRTPLYAIFLSFSATPPAPDPPRATTDCQ